MTTAVEQLSVRWHRIVDGWMARGVQYSRAGREPATGLDCWVGCCRILYLDAGIVLPDRDTGETAGDALKAYRDCFEAVPWPSRRAGDIAVFVTPDDTHALCALDSQWFVHASENRGIRRLKAARLWEMTKGDLTLHRYIGDGCDVFGG